MVKCVPPANFSKAELDHMREAGKILASLFRDVRSQVVEGVTGLSINDWFQREIKARGAHASYLDPEVNFPGVVCISVNDVIVHGVPNDKPFELGDVISFDLVIDVDGMKADSAFTMLTNDEAPTGAKKMLISITERSLYAGLEAAYGGEIQTGDIGFEVEQVLNKAHLGVVRDLVGHGIGRSMHMAPDVPNFGRRHTGWLVPAGNAIAVEPMATLGSYKIAQDDPDGWSIRTRDGSLAAHFEHTILLVENQPAEIITTL